MQFTRKEISVEPKQKITKQIYLKTYKSYNVRFRLHVVLVVILDTVFKTKS